MNKDNRRGVGLIFFILVLIVLALIYYYFFAGQTSYYTMGQLQKEIEQGRVVDVFIDQYKDSLGGSVTVTLSNGVERTVNVTNVTNTEQYLREQGLDPEVSTVPVESWFLYNVLPILIAGIMVIFVMILFLNAQTAAMGGGTNSKLVNFGKSRARMIKDNKYTLKDVAGLKEEKEELAEVIDFLKDPGKYTNLGARIPKGLLLEGPPGTGKTLLAKAVAGEAGVPFFSISGSDFVEMFVGVGASRVRDLFEDAKMNKPCIVFIDEIDAVARKRGTGLGGGHDEREQTLNQMLVEMDGFEENSGIIVMAATNRVDILDPAILRPGRFDRKIMVGRPDVQGREEILNVHARNKKMGDDVNLKKVAQTTAGFTGADLENLLNEAAISAAKENKSFIVDEDITKAFVKVGIGTEKKSRLVSDKEKRITAYHEAGHAILFHELPDMDEVYTISIIPTGVSAAGYTMPLPTNDNMFRTRGEMLQHIQTLLGGRIAEEIIFDDITTGASNDIERATSVARDMVTRFGMSKKMGLINYKSDSDEVFIGNDLAHSKPYSEGVASQIDEEIKAIIDECYIKAKKILTDNIEILHKTANLLIEKERISMEEFNDIFEKKDIFGFPEEPKPEV